MHGPLPKQNGAGTAGFGGLSLLFFVPFCGIPLFLNVAGPNPFAALFPVLFIVGVIGVGAWFVLNYFQCPRCEKLFAVTWWYNLSIVARKCVRGLLKFGDGDHA